MSVTHDHPDHTSVTVGCLACIERVKRDQWNAELKDLDDDELVEVAMAREHIPDDWQHAAALNEISRRFDARVAEQ